jgi:hypothetical protein
MRADNGERRKLIKGCKGEEIKSNVSGTAFAGVELKVCICTRGKESSGCNNERDKAESFKSADDTHVGCL